MSTEMAVGTRRVTPMTWTDTHWSGGAPWDGRRSPAFLRIPLGFGAAAEGGGEWRGDDMIFGTLCGVIGMGDKTKSGLRVSCAVVQSVETCRAVRHVTCGAAWTEKEAARAFLQVIVSMQSLLALLGQACLPFSVRRVCLTLSRHTDNTFSARVFQLAHECNPVRDRLVFTVSHMFWK